MDPVIVLFGLGVGILVGTTGLGGGALMTPLLILVLGVQPVTAVGTDLAYAAVTKTVGGWRHFRQGAVDIPLALWMAVGSIPGALIGVWILSYMRAHIGPEFDDTVLTLVGAALLLTSFAVFLRTLMFVHKVERHKIDLKWRHKLTAIVVGLVVGIVLAITSAGSGALIAMALILLFRLTPIRVVGTDVFHAAILLWVAGTAHLMSGNVDLPLTLNILIGSIPGVWLGSSLASRLPANGLRPALGILLFASGLALVAKGGMAIAPIALVMLPLLLSALIFVAYIFRVRTLRAKAEKAAHPSALK
jgi:uncharacterized membrane protein YfcA